MTFTLWAVCVIAAIGFAFDTYELLMLPLVVRNALADLGGIQPGTDEFARWFGLLLYLPAVCGGIFGLLGGYLTDRLGRRRVLTWSILLYACSAFAAGYSTNLWMLLVLRTTTFVGVCVEFVAATAWLAELFDDPPAARKGARIHPGVLFAGRPARRDRQWTDCGAGATRQHPRDVWLDRAPG
jgi:MFS family permease